MIASAGCGTTPATHCPSRIPADERLIHLHLAGEWHLAFRVRVRERLTGPLLDKSSRLLSDAQVAARLHARHALLPHELQGVFIAIGHAGLPL